MNPEPAARHLMEERGTDAGDEGGVLGRTARHREYLAAQILMLVDRRRFQLDVLGQRVVEGVSERGHRMTWLRTICFVGKAPDAFWHPVGRTRSIRRSGPPH